VNAIRGTFRPWVVVALIGWTIAIAIPIIFQGGSVRAIRAGADQPGSGGLPWVEVWLVGILVILVVGFLARKRA
jgi:hypothetical protein